MIGAPLITPGANPAAASSPTGNKRKLITPAMSPYTLLAEDGVLMIRADTGPVVINLPFVDTAMHTRQVRWKRLDFAANNLTFNAFAGQNIDGNAAIIVPGAGSFMGGSLTALGDDSTGFLNGWGINSQSENLIVYTAGPSLTPNPSLTVVKMGSNARGIQPYTQGVYSGAPQRVAVNNFQLQSYMDLTWVAADTIGVGANILLNGLADSQLHRIKNTGAVQNLTVVPQGGHTIDGAANLVLGPGIFCTLAADLTALMWRRMG